jgi:DNA replication protein DnaC
MKAEIAMCCKSLRLSSNIAATCDEVEAQSNQEYLLKILRNEVAYRRANRHARLIKQAGFYSLKTFEGYSFDEIRLPAELTVAALKEVAFVDDKKNLILYGGVGTGKTHLATAIGVEACKRDKRVMFFRTAALVNHLNELQKKGGVLRFFKQLSKTDLLICDEWGYVPLDLAGSKLLFQAISDCYEARSVVVTTNLEFSKWVNIFYDEQMTAAMIDRLVHHSHLLLFEGQSHRIKNSLMRTQ